MSDPVRRVCLDVSSRELATMTCALRGDAARATERAREAARWRGIGFRDEAIAHWEGQAAEALRLSERLTGAWVHGECRENLEAADASSGELKEQIVGLLTDIYDEGTRAAGGAGNED